MPDKLDLEARTAVLESQHRTMREDLQSDVRDLGKAMREGFEKLAIDSRRDNDKLVSKFDTLSESVTQGRIVDAKHDREIESLKALAGPPRQRMPTLDESLPAAPPDTKRNAAIATFLLAAAGAVTAAVQALAH